MYLYVGVKMMNVIKDAESLSNEELVSLINTGNNELLQLLFKRFDSVLHSKAHKFSSYADLDDLIQEGLIALFSATKVFNSALSSFSTFASICIERAMCTHYRKALAKKQIPENQVIYFDDINSLQVFSTPESNLIEKEECTFLTEQIKKILSKNEYRILLAFLSGDTYEEIAQSLNCSVKTVNNALFRARRKIKELH